ncbi:MAG TPA: OsmC family peroxiredoxin [Gaiellaceae bacterium]|nr:OsmC family peroxiredoxin [Gaiellaceae bacterium]
MPRIERNADIVWEGNVARGNGTITPATGAFPELPFTLASRIAAPEGKTSPEELLASAHGACFTMSLANELVQAGTPPGRLEINCRIVMDEVSGQGHQIVGSVLQVRADVEGADDAALDAAIAKADEGCPFSALLKRAGADVQVSR